MTTFCILMIVVTLCSSVPILVVELRKTVMPKWSMIVAAIMAVACAYLLNYQCDLVIGNSELVTTVVGDTGEEVQIYYDESADQYFRKDVNNWNPIQVFYRTNLNNEEVEEYLEYTEKIESINLLD